MPNEDPNKIDVSKQQPSTTDNAESSELSDDDLKTVSGGLISTGGSPTTATCLL